MYQIVQDVDFLKDRNILLKIVFDMKQKVYAGNQLIKLDVRCLFFFTDIFLYVLILLLNEFGKYQQTLFLLRNDL